MATKKQKTKVENREPNDAVNVGKKDIRKDHILVVEDDTAELETLAEVLVADDREYIPRKQANMVQNYSINSISTSL